MVDLEASFRTAHEKNASAIYLSTGLPPGLRIDGALHFLPDAPALSHGEVEDLVRKFSPPGGQEPTAAGNGALFTRTVKGWGNVRISVSTGLNGTTLVCRPIPREIPSLDDLGLPALLKRSVSFDQGLVLVIGSAGSGKTTTLASLVDHANRNLCREIFTFENPAEFRHRSHRSRIRQMPCSGRAEDLDRMLSPSFLKSADILVMDGLPRSRVITAGLEAARRGLLVLASLEYSGGVAETIKGLIDSCPLSQRDEMRRKLSGSLRVALWQHLLPRKDGTGSKPACEIMVNDRVIINLIRQPRRLQLIRPAMAAARPYGMQTMRQALEELRRGKEVDPDVIASFEDTVYSHFVYPVKSSF